MIAKNRAWVFAACVISALVSFALTVSAAYGQESEKPQRLYYDPVENPVADRTVHLNVNKLDTNSHDYVKGAKLRIIDKATGKVMIEWTSGSETAEIDRELDIDTPYILQEVEAPEGYEKAEDVEFTLRSVNFETKGEVTKGAETADGETNAEFNNISGDIESQAFVITLYDAKEAVEKTEKRTETRTTERSESNEEHTSNNQTNNRQRTITNSDSISSSSETSNNESTSNTTTTPDVVVTNTENEEVIERQNETTTTRTIVETQPVVTQDTAQNVVQNTVADQTRSVRQTTVSGLTQTADATEYVPLIAMLALGLSLLFMAQRLGKRSRQ